MFKYMFITDNAEVAEYVESCGVNRIFVDLERNGKIARQGHLNTVISQHDPANIELISRRLKSADLMVRLNPLHAQSESEIEMVIDSGCTSIMLPMFESIREVEQISEYVRGRVNIIPLVETIGATQCISEVSLLDAVSEIHIGLNDLHLQMKKRFMFELIADGTVEHLMTQTHKPTGFGGIARVGSGTITAELVMAEHVRMGSSGVILSRAFHNNASSMRELNQNIDFRLELHKLNEIRSFLMGAPDEHINLMHSKLCAEVLKVVANG